MVQVNILKNNNAVLANVVACLSGYDDRIKSRLRAAVTSLGGTAMGRFDPAYVTHLVVDAPEGSKYENWRRHYELGSKGNNNNNNEVKAAEWAQRLAVVRSGWILACEREGRLASEDGYRLPLLADNDNDNNADADADNADDDFGPKKKATIIMEAPPSSANNRNYGSTNYGAGGYSSSDPHRRAEKRTTRPKRQPSLPNEIRRLPSSSERCNWLIRNRPAERYCHLFARRNFVLAGFDEDDGDGDDDRDGSGCGDGRGDRGNLPPAGIIIVVRRQNQSSAAFVL